MSAVGPREHQSKSIGTVFEIVQRLRIGLRGIGMIDPLHDLPWRRGRAASDGARALCARIDGFDP